MNLLDLIAGHRVTAVIYVAVRLDIAGLIAEAPKTSAELARLTDTHERSLLRLLHALVTLGICQEADAGRFELTEMGTQLTAGSELSVKAWALTEGEMLRAGWDQLVESIRTGKTANELAGRSRERFEEMAAAGQAELFNQGMMSLTRVALPALLAAFELSGISTILDVGGGLGELMSAILKKYPSMRGVVLDLPHCAEAARKTFADFGVADRCEFVAGSFFDSVPAGADAIVVKSVIHDWSDERCVRILQNCHRALKPGALLMVIERILPEKLQATADDLSLTLSDLNMLRGPGGRERTESEFGELLAKGGFRMRRVVPADRYNVIEAVVA